MKVKIKGTEIVGKTKMPKPKKTDAKEIIKEIIAKLVLNNPNASGKSWDAARDYLKEK